MSQSSFNSFLNPKYVKLFGVMVAFCYLFIFSLSTSANIGETVESCKDLLGSARDLEVPLTEVSVSDVTTAETQSPKVPSTNTYLDYDKLVSKFSNKGIPTDKVEFILNTIANGPHAEYEKIIIDEFNRKRVVFDPIKYKEAKLSWLSTPYSKFVRRSQFLQPMSPHYSHLVKAIDYIPGIVLVSFSSSDLINSQYRYKSDLELALISRFVLLNLQMVNRAYRSSKLIPSDVKASFEMFNDFGDYIEDSKMGSKIEHYLLFRKEVWNAYVQVLNARVNELAKLERKMWTSGGYNQDAMRAFEFKLNELSIHSEPLYPISGISKFFQSDPQPMAELFRYFSNRDISAQVSSDDPFHLVDIGEMQNYQYNFTNLSTVNLRQMLVRDIISEVSDNTVLIVHAFSDAHKRYYQSLGFNFVKNVYNSRWNMNGYELANNKSPILAGLSQSIGQKNNIDSQQDQQINNSFNGNIFSLSNLFLLLDWSQTKYTEIQIKIAPQLSHEFRKVRYHFIRKIKEIKKILIKKKWIKNPDVFNYAGTNSKGQWIEIKKDEKGYVSVFVDSVEVYCTYGWSVVQKNKKSDEISYRNILVDGSTFTVFHQGRGHYKIIADFKKDEYFDLYPGGPEYSGYQGEVNQ
jgi:hypothetical protein